MKSQPVTTYVTSDGKRWLNVQHPDGLVPPPTFTLHEPHVGPVEFYFAECYQLPIPPEARQAARGAKT
jgi:hypothetical protein